MERSVQAVSVEMVDVLAQHCGEVPWSGDQDAFEAFAPKRAAVVDMTCLRRQASIGEVDDEQCENRAGLGFRVHVPPVVSM
jgi:hypothetical protein